MENCAMKKQVVLVTALAAAVSTAFAARTVRIDAQTESTVTLGFGGADGYDYELFLASGSADARDDKYAWDSFEKVADIGAEQTSLVR